MKQFIIKAISFFLIAGIALTSFELYEINYRKQYRTKVIGHEVYRSILKSKTKKQVKKLLLGDSVAKQLYDNYEYNDSIYSLCCNQAVTMAGHYFLLNNFLETNKDQLPQEIIMMYFPFSLVNNVDMYAFNYLLKPFYNSEYKKLMDDYLLDQIKGIPFYYISQFPFIKTSNYSPEYYLEYEKEGLFSTISKIYLEKIVQLCQEKNVVFRFESAPIKMDNKKLVEYYKPIKINIPDIGHEMLENYFANIRYFEDSLFRDFGHFKREYVPHDYLNLEKNSIDSLEIIK